MKIAAIFNAAVEMEAGKEILVPASTFVEMERIRIALYRERKKHKNSEICIYRYQKEGKYGVSLKKDTLSTGVPVILNQDGSVDKALFEREEK